MTPLASTKASRYHRRFAMGRKVHLASLGCPKNQVDAEIMLGSLVRDGWEVTLDPAEADVLLVNTCSFIQPAKEESIDTILEMARYKAAESGRKLVVTGCLAERYGRQLQSEMPEVDAFVGTGDYLRLSRVLEDLGSRSRARPLAYVGAQHVLPDHEAPRLLSGSPFSAYLKISEGCNHRCAFCIIPKIRGRHESRGVADLTAEARNLAAQGVRELNLIAQDLTAYGRDLPERSSLAELLSALGGVDGIEWIRLLYCHPSHVTAELLATMAREPRVCRYLDIPLQHGADRMLRAMRRERSADALRRLVGRIRARVPGVTIRTSFIVGFPGETESDFGELCRFVTDLEFERVGVFRYSQEEDTEAGVMAEQVSEEVKEERWHRLMALQREISRRKNQALVGDVLPVLVCGTDDDGKLHGRLAGQAPDIDGVVFLDAVPDELDPGTIVRVRIDGASDYDLAGTPLPDMAPPVIDLAETRP
ncbi:MAG: ribosomal protein methylthiotransferase [Candidatus Binatota bacterium]|nr:ribosomal protein methylthiotransferase [Candidatus Binatota bacterium]